MTAQIVKKILFPCMCMLWAASYYAEVLKKPETSRFTIEPVFFILLALFVVICISEVRDGINKQSSSFQSKGKVSTDIHDLSARLRCLSVSCLFLALIPVLGFAISTLLYLVFSFTYLNPKHAVKNIAVAVFFTVLVCYSFEKVLWVPLPEGLWWGK